MAITTIDTHEVVKELIAAGFTDEQAEAVTRQLRRAQDIDLSDLMTKTDGLLLEKSLKADFAMLEKSVKADISAVKSDLEKSLAETKAELLKWMVSTIGVQTVVILGSVVTLIRLLSH